MCGRPPVEATTNLYLLRLLLYLGVGAGLCEGVVAMAERGYSLALASEEGPLEFLQFVVASVSSAALFVLARRSERFPVVLRLLAALALFSAARELDHFMAGRGAKHAYMLLTSPVGLYAAYTFVLHYRRLVVEVAEFVTTPAFTFLFVGFFIVVLFAQIVGQKNLWQALMGDGYLRHVKDITEETLEMLGYLVISFGTVETYFLTRGERRDPSEH